MGKTLFDKIWDTHVVQDVPDGPTQLYIDRLYCHEVTSPQAFDTLRDKGIGVLRPQQIFAMPDHNTPSTSDAPLPVGAKQMEALKDAEKSAAAAEKKEKSKRIKKNGKRNMAAGQHAVPGPGSHGKLRGQRRPQ